jgi:methyl-accepting chemotaxis protein
MTILSRLTSRGPFRSLTGSIRTKLLLTMTLLALVPLIVLGVGSYQLIAQSIRRNQLEFCATVAREKESQVTALLERNLQLLEACAQQRWLRDRLRLARQDGPSRSQAVTDAAEHVKDLQGISGEIDGVTVLDPRGAVVVGTQDGGRDRARDPAYTGAMASPGKPFLKPISLSPTTGKVEQVLSVTIPDDPSRGTILGVLVFRLNTAGLQKIVASSGELGETAESLLINEDRQLVTQARLVPENTVLNQTVDFPGVEEAFRQGQATQGVSLDYRGVPVLATSLPLPRWKLVLVSKIDVAEALALIDRLRWLTAGVIGGTALLVLAIAMGLSSGLTRQVRHITETFDHIARGDYTARARVSSADELGAVAGSLNAMLDNTLGLIQSRGERDAMQQSIRKLLEEISGVAEGDLTKEAEVTADVTGAIADSFNFMIEQLRRIISNVQDATGQVSYAANQIHATAEQLVQGSEGQARQIVSTSASVEEMAQSIRQVAQSADRSREVAEHALASARQGTAAVHDTIGGMNRIRDQVQETAKRIKRLGESSQQIGEIVQLIDDIADRTSILALNASIQAAMAGEAGRGFAVVAGEVERLAERSAAATRKIAGLVKAIQSETNEAVTAMEEGTREVVEGSRLANQAGQALAEIETISAKLAGLIQAIAEASRGHAVASEDVAQAMGEISDVTQRTAAGTRQGAIAVTHLASLADDLRNSVSTFRLPGNSSRAGLAPRPAAPRNGGAPRPAPALAGV